MTPENVAKWIIALGGRRYLLCIGCAFINTLVFLTGLFHIPPLLTETGYLTIIGGTVIAYLGSNTTQKVKNKEGDPQ